MLQKLLGLGAGGTPTDSWEGVWLTMWLPEVRERQHGGEWQECRAHRTWITAEGSRSYPKDSCPTKQPDLLLAFLSLLGSGSFQLQTEQSQEGGHSCVSGENEVVWADGGPVGGVPGPFAGALTLLSFSSSVAWATTLPGPWHFRESIYWLGL